MQRSVVKRKTNCFAITTLNVFGSSDAENAGIHVVESQNMESEYAEKAVESIYKNLQMDTRALMNKRNIAY